MGPRGLKFEWSRAAGRDRDSIFDYIAGDDFGAAVTNDQRIAAIEAQLSSFPESGRRGKVKGTREWVVANTPFVAVYRIEPTRVLVLRVIHGAQRWPPKD